MSIKQSHHNISDEQLMRLYSSTKKAEIFTTVYKRNFKSLVKYLVWLCGDSDEAKDISQNIFMKVYNKPHLFDASKNFKVWLYSIAKNNWKNYIRRQSNQSKLMTEVKNINLPSVEIDEQLFSEDKFRQVRSAVDALSESHKETIILKYSNNLTIKEIAGILNCSEGTVKSRLFYALKKLKKEIKYGYQ